MSSDYSFGIAIRQRTGTAFLLLGVVAAVLVYVDRTGSGELSFPVLWYRTRSLHLICCIVAFVLGAVLLRNPEAADEVDISNDDRSPVFRSVVVYSRPGCSLCDKAVEQLRRHQAFLPEITVVDISRDEQLETKYGNCIPVVVVDGRIRFRGHIDEVLLTRLIRAVERRKNDNDDPNALTGISV